MSSTSQSSSSPLFSRYVHLVQPNGSVVATSILKGSPEERQFTRVMIPSFADRYGKLYFSSKDKFSQWNRQGRRKNVSTGKFFLAKEYHGRRMAEMAEGDGGDGGDDGDMNGDGVVDDGVVIEEYTVEYEEEES